VPQSNTCNVQVNNCELPSPSDRCLIGANSHDALKMCQLGQSLCNSDSDCPQAGDTCGPPTSRTVIAKRTLSRVISENYNIVNMGLMTFRQGGYFDYYKIDNPKYSTEKIFLNRLYLEANDCWDSHAGPTNTCAYKGVTYALHPGLDSRYVVNKGDGVVVTQDADYCGTTCTIDMAGTGLYQGSYYFGQARSGTVNTGRHKASETYLGKVAKIDGSWYRYYDTQPNYYEKYISPPTLRPDCYNTCSASCGGTWTEDYAPFINPEQSTAQALSSALQMLEWMNKGNRGGLITYGGTPSGCTIDNDGQTSWGSERYSAYRYMKKLIRDDGLACRQNYVLFITDGKPNGPGDVSCDTEACAAADPIKAGCKCRVVNSTYRLREELGVKTFVVGFSSDATVGEARRINDNVAKAGGTDNGQDNVAPYAFLASNESELSRSIQEAIYDAVRGSYSTSPATASTGEQLPNRIQFGNLALEARVDFPSWDGHLLAYDVSQDPPVLSWDANRVMRSQKWYERRVYVGTYGNSAVRIEIDPEAHNVVNKEALFALGIGSSPDEAERIAKFTLGDPEADNPIVLGAMVNSTPIDVGSPGKSSLPGGAPFFEDYRRRPALTYVGANDGMLHAFFTQPTTIGRESFDAGSEAFAYIPPGMISVVNQLYAQRGQVADPARHLFGLANSPKVKNLCLSRCDDPENALWRTVLVMNEGYGGNGLFMLDITNPVDMDTGFSDPPVMPIWHSDEPALRASYDAILGNSVSVPAFYFNKTDALNDQRLIFASGYKVDDRVSAQGRRVVESKVSSGTIVRSLATNPPASCSQEYALLADVATARVYEANQYHRLRAGYVGDTWGSLYRVRASGLSRVSDMGCDHPLHFAPAVVQLDRDDPENNSGETYLVQVTNSALDDETFDYPPSQMVIMKEFVNGSGDAVADGHFGNGGRVVLHVGKDSELCGVTDDAGNCIESLPAHARPTATPTAILKADGSGFLLLSMWYAQDANGCGKGTTWLNLHTVIGDTARQIQGLRIGDEPVTSPVIVGGRIYVVGSQGALEIGSNLAATVSAGASTPRPDVGAGRFGTLGWTEVE